MLYLNEAQKAADSLALILASGAGAAVAGVLIARRHYGLPHRGLSLIGAAGAACAVCLSLAVLLWQSAGRGIYSSSFAFAFFEGRLVLDGFRVEAVWALLAVLALGLILAREEERPLGRARLIALPWLYGAGCAAVLLEAGTLKAACLAVGAGVLLALSFPGYGFPSRSRRLWAIAALPPAVSLVAAAGLQGGGDPALLWAAAACVWSLAFVAPAYLAVLSEASWAGVFLLPAVGGIVTACIVHDGGNWAALAWLSALTSLTCAGGALFTNDFRRLAAFMNLALLHQLLSPIAAGGRPPGVLLSVFPALAFAMTGVLAFLWNKGRSGDRRFLPPLEVAGWLKVLLGILLFGCAGLLLPGPLLSERARSYGALFRSGGVLLAGTAQIASLFLFLAFLRLLGHLKSGGKGCPSELVLPVFSLGLVPLLGAGVRLGNESLNLAWAAAALAPAAAAGVFALVLRGPDGIGALWSRVDPRCDLIVQILGGPALPAAFFSAAGGTLRLIESAGTGLLFLVSRAAVGIGGLLIRLDETAVESLRAIGVGR